MQKLKNQAGFSHIAVIAAIVVMASLVGIFTVVKSNASTCVQNTYSTGVNGSTCVKHIQSLTNYFLKGGGKTLLGVDGNYGSKTKAGVVYVQGLFRLKTDGVVGPNTWKILCHPQKGPAPVSGYPYSAARAAGCSV